MDSFNGIGTTFYGKKNIKSDSSYDTVKWFIFLLIPIYPISGYRVKKIYQSKLGGKIEYEIIQKFPVEKTFALKSYLIFLYSVVLLFVFIFLLSPFI
jgi:hypothetical protein